MRSDDEEKVMVAIKEFELMKKLDHPNIVAVKDIVRIPGFTYIIMELVEGPELFDAIAKKEKYSERDAQLIFKQLLEALQYLHTNKVCHRDIKPSNLLIREKDNVLKVTDFNISKIQKGACMNTQTGTEPFKAPEVVAGEGYSNKVDMWGAGCVLYTMLMGFQPFQDTN